MSRRFVRHPGPAHTGAVAHTDESAVRAVYDTVADLYADYFPSTDPEQALDLAMISHFATLLGPGAKVLDAGCGAGRMLPVLAGLGCAIEGVDLSPEMVRRAQADHGEFRTQVASLTALPASDGAFDGVFAWYSTIHCPDEDLPRIFAEAHRVLRDGGLLLTAFQTGAGPREIGQAFRDRGHDVELVRHHRSPAQVAAALDSAGFDLTATMDRAAVGEEADGQAVLIARRRA